MKNLVRYTIPYDDDKNLGFAYNDEVRRTDPGKWVAFCDRDTFLHYADFAHRIASVIERHGDGIYTSTTNRTNCSWQRLKGIKASNDIDYHTRLAESQWKKYGTDVEEHTDSQLMSGHLIIVKRELWTNIEQPGILGIDNQVHLDARAKGIPVYLMKGIYQYHWYSNYSGVYGHRERDKTHLR